MKKLQIRQGVFETNSSSIHSLCIAKNSDVTKYPETVVFTPGQFGWEFELYQDTSSKASYLWEAILGVFEGQELQNAISKITEILAEVGVKAEFPYNHFEEVTYGDDKKYSYVRAVNIDNEPDEGYIDHVYETKGIVKCLLENPQHLLSFLFDSNSFIATGNDNSEYDLDYPENYIRGKYFEYTKGN